MAYVQALKSFTYDEKQGKVQRGQVFKSGGHVNDNSLLEHRFIIPFTGKVSDLPVDSRGRRFVDAGAKERAGDVEQVPAREALEDRRAAIAGRVSRVGA